MAPPRKHVSMIGSNTATAEEICKEAHAAVSFPPPIPLSRIPRAKLATALFRPALVLHGAVTLRSALLFPHQRGPQESEFGFHFRRIGHCLRNLLAEEVAIALAEPVNGHFERSLGSVQFAS